MGKRLTFEQVPEAVAQLLEEMAEIKKLLKAQPAPVKTVRTSSKSAAAPGEIGIDEVCVILKRSKQTVYALVKSGKLKVRKQGRNLLFIKAEIEAYAASPKKNTRGRKKAEPAAKAKVSRKPASATKAKANAGTKATSKVRATPKAKSKINPKPAANAGSESELQANATPEATAASAKSGDKKLRFPRFGKTGGKGTSRTQKPPKPEAAASAPESQNPPEETK